MDTDKKHIYLIGPSGVGKSTVGKLLADNLKVDFIDLDEEIEKIVGTSIAEFFNQKGEAAFREIERETISQKSKEQQQLVVATGGGSVLDTRNVAAMKQTGYIFYLSALEADLIQRVKQDQNGKRPLLVGDVEDKIHQQLESRRSSYELAADVTIATSKRDIETVVNALQRQYGRLNGTNIDLSSSIIVGESILNTLGNYLKSYPQVVLISQDNIPAQYSDDVISSFKNNSIEYLHVTVPDGEVAKSFESYKNVITQMSEFRVMRSACVVALGGGVVGDLSGFVASTYHRGIDVIQVPTTLLAQVDSSVGGKCGINLETGKNLVGSFHQPKLIFVDTKTLSTLNDSDFKSGLGEVTKYALLGNLTLKELIQTHSKEILERDAKTMSEVVKSCISQKLNVVSRDPLETTGLRATLNLGHTLAHAIETKTKYEIAHGQAVAIGLRFVAELSFNLGRIPESQKIQSISLIDSLNLESQVPDSAKNPSELLDLMYSDKKSDGELSFVLMNVGGESELVHGIDREVVESTLESFLS